jgi:condensin complex subunit 2
VAVKVPSNVTVSFYFICMLHLANEKGLELKGQEDLSDFQIRAGNNNSHMIKN